MYMRLTIYICGFSCLAIFNEPLFTAIMANNGRTDCCVIINRVHIQCKKFFPQFFSYKQIQLFINKIQKIQNSYINVLCGRLRSWKNYIRKRMFVMPEKCSFVVSKRNHVKIRFTYYLKDLFPKFQKLLQQHSSSCHI